ncbi:MULTISPECIES: ArsR family transcriptional regulator [Haloferax]|uniref:ArsR family transcriptional regulator n=2 Tax=Haloferax TaxID=2251 RepID=A0A6G1YZ20_9EURY|nr:MULTISPECIES: ArsR family transcriptional regulator [Haloferax]KAB1186673.1 ArsR family transcriptional regulator [Haloferax sp. CBA1149]MRW79294.1 ArsR family transcriptional regulator [Haloferax marinisediminis]
MATTPDTELSETRIHEVLSNDRRRMAIEFLQDGDLTLRELSERIAEAETGESPPPRNIRQSAYVSLQQTHIPKLDELDIVTYDEGSKTVSLAEAGDVTVYMEVVPEGELSWSEYYTTLSALGLVLMTAVAAEVPVISSLGAPVLASVVFAVIGGSGLYQRWSQEN